LNAARFLNAQNGGADFRVVAEAPGFAVGKLTLKRRSLAPSPHSVERRSRLCLRVATSVAFAF